MTFTVADVIEGARDLSPVFTPTRHPDPVCVRYLTRYCRTLAQVIAERRPEALSVLPLTVPLTTYDWVDGVGVHGVLYVVDVRVHRTGYPVVDDAYVKVDLVPAGDRYTRGQLPPAAWLSGVNPTVLRLIGTPVDYAHYDSIRIRYVTMPTAGEMNFPDDALDVCVLSLGAFLADRQASMAPENKDFDTTPFHANAMEASTSFLNRLTNQAGAEIWRIKRVG